jgi:hypothetical protein
MVVSRRWILAAAGATQVEVFEGSIAGFTAGQLVAFDRNETNTIASISGKIIKLAKPLTADHPARELFEAVQPRVLDWGVYHAMFVSVFVTDAMRKSGFPLRGAKLQGQQSKNTRARMCEYEGAKVLPPHQPVRLRPSRGSNC